MGSREITEIVIKTKETTEVPIDDNAVLKSPTTTTIKRKKKKAKKPRKISKYRHGFRHLEVKPPKKKLPRACMPKVRQFLARVRLSKKMKRFQKVQSDKIKPTGVRPIEEDLIIVFEQPEKQKYLKGRSNESLKEKVESLFTIEKLTSLMEGEEERIGDMSEKLKGKKTRVQKLKKSSLENSSINMEKASIVKVFQTAESRQVIPVFDPMDIEGGTSKEDLLSPLEHKFAIIYAQTGNGARSAELASVRSNQVKGSSHDRNESYFRRLGAELIKRPRVQRAIGLLQKKVCIAAALDAAEVISNIREIAALATVNAKYDAAIKANLLLGEYLGIFGKTKEERMKTVNQQAQVIEVFKTGEDLTDSANDIMKLSNQLGIVVSQGDTTNSGTRENEVPTYSTTNS